MQGQPAAGLLRAARARHSQRWPPRRVRPLHRPPPNHHQTPTTVHNLSRKAFFLKALGPLTVCIISIALMNIFGWYDTPSAKKPYIKSIGKIPKGEFALPIAVGWWWVRRFGFVEGYPSPAATDPL